jgi:hypothetical protein
MNNFDKKQYIDEEIALNIFEKNYVEGLYTEVQIKENKATATESGSTI